MSTSPFPARIASAFLLTFAFCCSVETAIAQPADDSPTPHGGLYDEILIVERDGFNIVPGQASKIGRFYSNNTGGVTVFGGTPSQPVFTGMDYKPGSGVLFGIETSTNSLRSIHPVLGTSTVVGLGSTIPLDPFRLGGLTFNATGNVLYATDSNSLYSIDESNGSVIAAYAVHFIGLPAGLDLGDIAVAPVDVSTDPPIPAGTLLGVAVGAFPQPARLVRIALNEALNRADVSLLAFLQTGVFQVGYYDQGLDFSPEGILYACLQGEFQSATMYRVDVSSAATLGQCTLMGVVHNNPGSWSVGDVAIGPNPILVCPTCRGDMTGDDLVDGRDIQEWARTAVEYALTLSIPPGKHCADMNSDDDVDCSGAASDLALFLTRIMDSTSECAP